MSEFFKPRSKAIIHELLDDEIILADLDSGMYFSIREGGIPIWQLLLAGYSFQEMNNLFQEKYHTDPSEELRQFTSLLLKEQLLIKTIQQEKIALNNLFWPNFFKSPVLEKYEEMKNLLMLDPIHEVDEQGWPVKKGHI